MAKAATKTTTPARVEGDWSSEPAYFEKAIDDKRTLKACIATSPDGKKFVSIREWRVKANGEPYYTRNAVLSPVDDPAMREAFVAALQAQAPTSKKAPAVDHSASNRTIAAAVKSGVLGAAKAPAAPAPAPAKAAKAPAKAAKAA